MRKHNPRTGLSPTLSSKYACVCKGTFCTLMTSFGVPQWASLRENMPLGPFSDAEKKLHVCPKRMRTCKMYASKRVSTLLAFKFFQLISSILCHGRLYYLKIQIWNYYIVHSSCTQKVYTVMLSFDPWKINWCRHHLVWLRTVYALAAHYKISSGVNKNIAVIEYRF